MSFLLRESRHPVLAPRRLFSARWCPVDEELYASNEAAYLGSATLGSDGLDDDDDDDGMILVI
jgi:hypothetical protein